MSSSEKSDAQELMFNKREKLSVQIRKQKREDVLRTKRVIFLNERNISQQVLSLFSQEFIHNFPQYIGQIEEVYRRTLSQQISGQYIFQPDDNQNSYIEHLILLQKFVQDFEITQDNFRSERAVEVISMIMNNGLPQIDYVCLDILYQFSISDTVISMPIFDRGHIPKILQLLAQTDYEVLQEKCLTILRNLCADCPQFRDQIFFFDSIQQIYQLFQNKFQGRMSLVVEYIWLLYNMIYVTPKLSTFNTHILIQPLTFMIENYADKLQTIDLECFQVLIKSLKTIFRQNQGNQSIYDYYTPSLSRILVKLLQTAQIIIQIDIVDILSMISFVSKDKYDNELQANIVNGIANTLIQTSGQSKICEKLQSASFMALSNYIIDGQNIIILLNGETFKNSLHKIDASIGKKSMNSMALFYRNLALTCSTKQFLDFFMENNYKIFRNVMSFLENQDTELVITCLQFLLIIFTQFQKIDSLESMMENYKPVNQLPIYTIFEQEGGLNMLHQFQSHQSNQVYEEVEKIQILIDII